MNEFLYGWFDILLTGWLADTIFVT